MRTFSLAFAALLFACGPTPGMDCYDKTGQLLVSVTGVGQDAVNLAGLERLVHGPIYDAGGGVLRFDTELLQLDWSGPSGLFGPVTVQESPSLPSVRPPVPTWWNV